MKLLTPLELSRAREMQVLSGFESVMIADPSETVEAVGRIVANRNVPVSGMTAPFGTNVDTGRIELSGDVAKRPEVGTRLQQAHKKKDDEEGVTIIECVVEQPLQEQLHKNFRCKFASMLQRFKLEASNKLAATTPRHLLFDNGRQPCEGNTEIEDFMDHRRDGIRRCYSSSIISFI